MSCDCRTSKERLHMIFQIAGCYYFGISDEGLRTDQHRYGQFHGPYVNCSVGSPVAESCDSSSHRAPVHMIHRRTLVDDWIDSLQ